MLLLLKLNTDKMTEIHEWSSKKSLMWNADGVKLGGKGAPNFPKYDFTWCDNLTAHTWSTADSRLLVHLANAPQAPPAPRPHESCLESLKFKTCKKNAPFWYHKGPKMSLGPGFSFHHSVCGLRSPPKSQSAMSGKPCPITAMGCTRVTAWEHFGHVMIKGFFHICQRWRCWAWKEAENSQANLAKKRKFERLCGKVS